MPEKPPTTERFSEKIEIPPDLQDVIALSQYRDELNRWDESRLKELVRQTLSSSEVKPSNFAIKDRQNRIIEKWKTAKKTIATALAILSSHDEVRREWKDVAGKKIATHKEAYEHSHRLMQKLHNSFVALCEREGCATDHTGETTKRVAHTLLGDSKEILRALEVLPGPHHKLLNNIKTQHSEKEFALEFLRSVAQFYPEQNHVDFDSYSLADMDHLQKILRKGTALGAHILESNEDELEEMFTEALPQEEPVAPVITPPVSAEPLEPSTISRTANFERTRLIEFPERYTEMKELFGENFYGIAEVNRAFTVPPASQGLDADTALEELDDLEGLAARSRETPTERHLIVFIREMQERAHELLLQKIAEPDVAQFIEKIRHRELNPEDYLFMLRVGQFADGQAMTMRNLHERLQPAMQAQNQGKLLYDTTWYRNESFFTNADTDLIAKGNLEWVIVTKEMVPATLSKNHSRQTRELANEARRLGFASHRRRKPWEVVYDFAVALRGNNKRMFVDPYRYDWTDEQLSDGYLVDVGRGDSDGLGVSGWIPSDSLPDIGAALSR